MISRCAVSFFLEISTQTANNEIGQKDTHSHKSAANLLCKLYRSIFPISFFSSLPRARTLERFTKLELRLNLLMGSVCIGAHAGVHNDFSVYYFECLVCEGGILRRIKLPDASGICFIKSVRQTEFLRVRDTSFFLGEFEKYEIHFCAPMVCLLQKLFDFCKRRRSRTINLTSFSRAKKSGHVRLESLLKFLEFVVFTETKCWKKFFHFRARLWISKTNLENSYCKKLTEESKRKK